MIVGLWGSGENRKKLLTEYGYSYSEVQSMVNQILNGSAVTPSNTKQDQNQSISKKVVATCSAKQFSKAYAGEYKTTAVLYCRNDAGTNKKALCKIPAGTKVKCYGYYTMANGVKWLYIQFVLDGVQYTGVLIQCVLSKVGDSYDHVQTKGDFSKLTRFLESKKNRFVSVTSISMVERV